MANRQNRKPMAGSPRKGAFDILRRVEEGAFSDLALDATIAKMGGMDPRDRALLTELVYGVLRQRGRLDYALQRFCSQPLTKVEPGVVRLLRLACYQILNLDRVPDRAAVHESVELAKRLGLTRASGFINGVLRSLVREKESLKWPGPEKPLECLRHRYSLPKWLARRWMAELGAEQALALGQAMIDPPPFTVRVNTLKTSRPEYLRLLEEAGFEGRPTSFTPEGVVIIGGDRSTLPGDDDGLYQVQDEASMLMAHLLGPQPGERLLDACSAPGGKTTHLAALAQNEAEIVALDLHPARVKLVQAGARRLGCSGIEARQCDLTCPPDFLAPASFDRALVDAPCSGLGVLRRNPESRWRRLDMDIERLAKLQLTILGNVAPLVRPGGVLLYSLCTDTAEETEQVVEAFLEAHPDYRREDLRPLLPASWSDLFDAQGALRSWPHRHGGMDAFFAVRLRRRD